MDAPEDGVKEAIRGDFGSTLQLAICSKPGDKIVVEHLGKTTSVLGGEPFVYPYYQHLLLLRAMRRDPGGRKHDVYIFNRFDCGRLWPPLSQKRTFTAIVCGKVFVNPLFLSVKRGGLRTGIKDRLMPIFP